MNTHEVEDFFRIGDIVVVKTIKQVKETEGVYDCTRCNMYFSCHYKQEEYSVFCAKDYFTQGKTGRIVGGVYDSYLKVEIDGIECLFPHFALIKVEKVSRIGVVKL